MKVVCYHCKKNICEDIREVSGKELRNYLALSCPYCGRISFLTKNIETIKRECIHLNCSEQPYAIVNLKTKWSLLCCEKHTLGMIKDMSNNIEQVEILNSKAWVVESRIYYRDEEDVEQSDYLDQLEWWIEKNKNKNVFGKEQQPLNEVDIYFLQQEERKIKEGLDKCGKKASEKDEPIVRMDEGSPEGSWQAEVIANSEGKVVSSKPIPKPGEAEENHFIPYKFEAKHYITECPFGEIYSDIKSVITVASVGCKGGNKYLPFNKCKYFVSIDEEKQIVECSNSAMKKEDKKEEKEPDAIVTEEKEGADINITPNKERVDRLKGGEGQKQPCCANCGEVQLFIERENSKYHCRKCGHSGPWKE